VTERVRAEEEHRQLVAQKVVESALRNAAQRKDEFRPCWRTSCATRGRR
jgi:hypothetical protein